MTTAPAFTATPDFQRFIARLGAAVAAGEFVKLTLAKPRPEAGDLQRVSARPVRLRDQAALSLVYAHPTRDITKNHAPDDGLAVLRELLAGQFLNAHLHLSHEELQLSISRKGQCTLRGHARDAGALPAEPSHDRAKKRWIDPHRPFLHALGVTTAQGDVIPAMSRKWKQINKFIEIFAGALEASPLANAQTVRVVDFGSGKGYLTFAVHDWLREARQVDAQVTGVELRADMVALCERAIAQLALAGLRIVHGDVREHDPGPLDVMIALHACDIATDHAIHLGVRSGAQIILCSPCCHKELRPQLLSPHPLRPILQHGIHLGQQAEMLTDGLRAMLLEACGYDTQVFEFVSLEHTQKNKMILAVKRAQPRDAGEVLAQVGEIKRFYGVRDQCLETLLRAEGLIA